MFCSQSITLPLGMATLLLTTITFSQDRDFWMSFFRSRLCTTQIRFVLPISKSLMNGWQDRYHCRLSYGQNAWVFLKQVVSESHLATFELVFDKIRLIFNIAVVVFFSCFFSSFWSNRQMYPFYLFLLFLYYYCLSSSFLLLTKLSNLPCN